MASLKRTAGGVSRAVLSGTSTLLDVAYELSGRKVGLLHKSAAFLYDLSRTSDESAAAKPKWANGSASSTSSNTPASKKAKTNGATGPSKKAKTADKNKADDKKAAAKTGKADDKKAKTADKKAKKADDKKAAAKSGKKAKGKDKKAQKADAKAKEDKGKKATKLPIADYDSLNVKAISAALEVLDADQLATVRDYEKANKGRKTVLKAVDKLLAD